MNYRVLVNDRLETNYALIPLRQYTIDVLTYIVRLGQVRRVEVVTEAGNTVTVERVVD